VRKLDEKPRYIPTGRSVLDKHLHLSPGNLFIIGGRPSAGKTALSLQIEPVRQAREKATRSVTTYSARKPETLTHTDKTQHQLTNPY
jgi:Replicative DNA helicase